jgi:hypothetical protein
MLICGKPAGAIGVLNRVFEESDQIWSQHVSAGADFDAADRLLPSAKDYVACYRADENVLIALEM